MQEISKVYGEGKKDQTVVQGQFHKFQKKEKIISNKVGVLWSPGKWIKDKRSCCNVFTSVLAQKAWRALTANARIIRSSLSGSPATSADIVFQDKSTLVLFQCIKCEFGLLDIFYHLQVAHTKKKYFDFLDVLSPFCPLFEWDMGLPFARGSWLMSPRGNGPRQSTGI